MRLEHDLKNVSDTFAKKLEIQLSETNWNVPETDILDEPVRCYRVNLEWAHIVTGMVALLTDVGAWKDAETEDYAPIKQIQKFLQGSECDVTDYRLRQKPTDDCILQQSIDAGETWTDIFDFSLCLSHQTTTITGQLQLIERQNIINSGYSPTTTTITGDNGAYTEEELADMSIEADACDTDGKDALYGGIDRLVRYIHTKNQDFLQQVTQAANISQQIDRAISATPVLGLLPADELAGYIGFIVDELSQEYDATVDEDLLQTTICDLFCAAVNSGCMLSLNDVSNYFGDKVDATFSNAVSTLLNLIQFTAIGSFSGDDYFYFMCYFQLQIAMTKQRFLDIQSADTYHMQAQAGMNSPDHDWAIFCVDCPPQYRVWEWDFAAQGAGEFYLDTAVDTTPPGQFISGQGWKGTGDPSNPRLRIAMPWHPSWRVIAFAMNLDWTFATHGGSRSAVFRPTARSTAGQVAVAFGAGIGDYSDCRDTVDVTNKAELALDAFVSNAAGHVIINRIKVIFEADEYKPGAIITEDNTTCD